MRLPSELTSVRQDDETDSERGRFSMGFAFRFVGGQFDGESFETNREITIGRQRVRHGSRGGYGLASAREGIHVQRGHHHCRSGWHQPDHGQRTAYFRATASGWRHRRD